MSYVFLSIYFAMYYLLTYCRNLATNVPIIESHVRFWCLIYNLCWGLLPKTKNSLQLSEKVAVLNQLQQPGRRELPINGNISAVTRDRDF